MKANELVVFLAEYLDECKNSRFNAVSGCIENGDCYILMNEKGQLYPITKEINEQIIYNLSYEK